MTGSPELQAGSAALDLRLADERASYAPDTLAALVRAAHASRLATAWGNRRAVAQGRDEAAYQRARANERRWHNATARAMGEFGAKRDRDLAEIASPR